MFTVEDLQRQRAQRLKWWNVLLLAGVAVCIYEAINFAFFVRQWLDVILPVVLALVFVLLMWRNRRIRKALISSLGRK